MTERFLTLKLNLESKKKMVNEFQRVRTIANKKLSLAFEMFENGSTFNKGKVAPKGTHFFPLRIAPKGKDGKYFYVMCCFSWIIYIRTSLARTSLESCKPILDMNNSGHLQQLSSALSSARGFKSHFCTVWTQIRLLL